MKGRDSLRALLFAIILLILMNNVDTTEAVNWEIGSQYTLLSYVNTATLFGEILSAQSHTPAHFYFGFTLSDKVIVLPSLNLGRFGGRLASTVSFLPQYHPLGYTTSGVFVSGVVSAAFSSYDSPTLGVLGVGLGYQWRLKSNFVFRIRTSIGVRSLQYESESESGGSGSPRFFDPDAFVGDISTSLGYTFNMSD